MKNNINKGAFALILGISVFVVQLFMELFIRGVIVDPTIYTVVDLLVLLILIYGVYTIMKYKEKN